MGKILNGLLIAFFQQWIPSRYSYIRFIVHIVLLSRYSPTLPVDESVDLQLLQSLYCCFQQFPTSLFDSQCPAFTVCIPLPSCLKQICSSLPVLCKNPNEMLRSYFSHLILMFCGRILFRLQKSLKKWTWRPLV